MTTTDTTSPFLPGVEEKETVELTSALLHGLLRMTGGDPDEHTPEVRHLTRALHDVRWSVASRWIVELTETDVRTAHDLLVEYNERRRKPQMVRAHNYLTRMSEIYRRLYGSTPQTEEAQA